MTHILFFAASCFYYKIQILHFNMYALAPSSNLQSYVIQKMLIYKWHLLLPLLATVLFLATAIFLPFWGGIVTIKRNDLDDHLCLSHTTKLLKLKKKKLDLPSYLVITRGFSGLQNKNKKNAIYMCSHIWFMHNFKIHTNENTTCGLTFLSFPFWGHISLIYALQKKIFITLVPTWL